MNIPLLSAELIAGHPITAAYDADSTIAATQINLANVTRNRTTMSGRQIADEIVDAEYDTLTSDQKIQILSLVSSSDIDPWGFAANVIKDVFGVGSVTVSALAVARIETVSQATFVRLGWVKPGHIEQARAL